MKLCDRCKVSGCCLTYLGKACTDARSKVCPGIHANNAELLSNMDLVELADFLAKWVSNIWVDATISSAEVLEWLTDEPMEKAE